MQKRYKDDISTVKNFNDFEVINNIENWEIELIPNDYHVEEKNIPD